MKRIKTAMIISLLCLLWPGVVLGIWEEIALVPPYLTHPGSALCAGMGTEEDGVCRPCVWFMQNGEYWNDHFCRYDVATGERRDYPWPPFFPLPKKDSGSALAYVRDINSSPENGWVFAFRGGGSHEFWVFYPGANTWQRAPDVPEPVTKGGGLCYGRVEIGGVPYEVLYAFTGGYHQDAAGNYWGHFWRYSFQNLPAKNDGPLQGTWKRLADIPGCRMNKVLPCLVWLPMSDHLRYPMGLVVMMMNTIDASFGYFRHYHPEIDQWTEPGHHLRDKLTDGACITSNSRDATMFLMGDDYPRRFCFYNPVTGRIGYYYWTPEPVQPGAALTAFHWEDTAYVVFGDDGQFLWRWRYPTFGEENEGGQGTGKSIASDLKVEASSCGTAHHFFVTGVDGVVKLAIMDVTGRLVYTLFSKAENRSAEFTWNHPELSSGVYLWRVVSNSGGASGKILNWK